MRARSRFEQPTDDPEPIDWKPPPRLRDRIRRAVAVPAALGGTAFVGAVVVAIAMVALQPHTPAAELGDAGLANEEGPVDLAGEAEGSAGTEERPEAGGVSQFVFVHVVGEVNAPGVVELQPDARVEAAIAAAGGPTAAAVLAGVKLARPVVDGEQIVVPYSTNPAPPSGGPGGTSGSAGATGGSVNINLADAATLDTLPGIGPALAERIIDWRTANGGFSSVEQLLSVSGIGPKVFDRLRDRVMV